MNLIKTTDIILEKNVAKDQPLWKSCVAWAKSKYDVWPSMLLELLQKDINLKVVVGKNQKNKYESYKIIRRVHFRKYTWWFR